MHLTKGSSMLTGSVGLKVPWHTFLPSQFSVSDTHDLCWHTAALCQLFPRWQSFQIWYWIGNDCYDFDTFADTNYITKDDPVPVQQEIHHSFLQTTTALVHLSSNTEGNQRRWNFFYETETELTWNASVPDMCEHGSQIQCKDSIFVWEWSTELKWSWDSTGVCEWAFILFIYLFSLEFTLKFIHKTSKISTKQMSHQGMVKYFFVKRQVRLK